MHFNIDILTNYPRIMPICVMRASVPQPDLC